MLSNINIESAAQWKFNSILYIDNMAPNQVYGKRSHRYAQSNLFLSPKRKTPTAEILEIVEDCEILAVKDGVARNGDGGNKQRPALAPRSSNEGREPVVRNQIKKNATSDSSTNAGEAIVRSLPTKQTKTTEAICTRSSQCSAGPDAENMPPSTQDTEAIEDGLRSLTIRPPQSPPDIYQEHVADLLRHSYRPLTPFKEWSDQLSSYFTVAKIAEASFGEVYRLSLQKQHATLRNADESVLKIIALKPPPTNLKGQRLNKAAKKRIENMSDPADVASEVKLLQRMTCIPGFTNFRDVCMLKGRPGPAFVDAWKAWNQGQKAKKKEASVFPDPSRKTSYADDQLWAVIEMQDAGTDLENISVRSIWTVWDIFWGVVLSLGKGEEGARFEHRDLHLGNICISAADDIQNINDVEAASIDVSRKIGFTNISTTIIDYTLSRAEMQDQEISIGQADDIAYFDLEKDDAIFEGDGEQEYQYDIYRYMRSIMYLDDPLANLEERWDEAEASGRTWRGYHPQTNLVWLHFVLHKLLEQVEWPSSSMVDQDSAGIACWWQRSCELETALQRTQSLLDPQELPDSSLRSACDLISLALAEKWLDVEDVVGKKTYVGKKRGQMKERNPRA